MINISELYMELITCHALISVVYGLGILVFLYLRSRNPTEGRSLYLEIFDSLFIRIFVWIQIIFGSAVLGEAVIHKLSTWFK